MKVKSKQRQPRKERFMNVLNRALAINRKKLRIGEFSGLKK